MLLRAAFCGCVRIGSAQIVASLRVNFVDVHKRPPAYEMLLVFGTDFDLNSNLYGGMVLRKVSLDGFKSLGWFVKLCSCAFQPVVD